MQPAAPMLQSQSSLAQLFPLPRENCTQDEIQNKVYEKFRAIIGEAEHRKDNYAVDLGLLAAGFWYGNDYCKALTVKNQKARLDFFKKNGAFFHGLPPKGFEHVVDDSMPGGKRILGYTLKKGVAPVDALKSVRESLCFVDCQEPIQLAYYETLLEMWGEETFNKRFGLEGGTPLAFDTDTTRTPLIPLMSEQLFGATDENFYRSIQKGDELFFRNVPLYSLKQPEGDMGALHSLCSQAGGEKKFIALGIPGEGISEEQIFQLFAAAFNGPSLKPSDLYSGDFLITMQKQNESQIPADLRGVLPTMQITVDQIKAYRNLNPSGAGLQPYIRRLDAEKIKNLMPQAIVFPSLPPIDGAR